MTYLKSIIILTLIPLFLFLSGCGDSDSSHVGSWDNATLFADSARYPQVAADGNGNMIAVWTQSNGIYANRYDAVSGWGSPQQIADTMLGISDLHFAVSKSGHAIATWFKCDYLSINLQVVRYTHGAGWGAVENVDPYGIPKDVAIDDAGNAFIAGDFQEIYQGIITKGLSIAWFDQTSGWRFDRIEYTDAATGHSFPKVSVDGSGNGFLVWVEGYNDDYKVYVSTLSPAGLGAPQQIASLPGFSAAWTNIAVDDSGNAMVLWGQADSASVFHTYACRFTPAGEWGAPERIDDSPFDTIDQYLTVDPTGNFYAIWAQRTESVQTDIYSSSYSRSVGWQTPRRVGGGGNGRYPRIAADALGNVFAAWLQYDLDETLSADANVYANHYIADSGWGMQEQLKNVLGGADAPALAVDRSGRAMVIWSQSTGYVSGSSEIKYGIFSSRFE